MRAQHWLTAAAAWLLISGAAAGQTILSPFTLSAPAAAQYVTVRDTIKANNRDAHSVGTTAEELTSSEFEGELLSGLYSGTEYQAGYEFQLNIAQGATIDSAYLEIYVGGSYLGAADTIWHSVYDVDNAAVFDEAHAHSLTSHATMWSGSRAPLTAIGAHPYATFRIAVIDLVQHVVDRAGWTSGNYIGFVATKGTTVTSDEFVYIAGLEFGNVARTPRVVVYAH